jgi:hypothetical protein
MNPSGQVHGDALTPHVVFHVEPPLCGGHREEVRRVSVRVVKKDVLEMASTSWWVVSEIEQLKKLKATELEQLLTARSLSRKWKERK